MFCPVGKNCKSELHLEFSRWSVPPGVSPDVFKRKTNQTYNDSWRTSTSHVHSNTSRVRSNTSHVQSQIACASQVRSYTSHVRSQMKVREASMHMSPKLPWSRVSAASPEPTPYRGTHVNRVSQWFTVRMSQISDMSTKWYNVSVSHMSTQCHSGTLSHMST